MKVLELKTPLKENQLHSLNKGMKVNLTGKIYTARDRAHEKLVKDIKKRKKLPFNLKNSIIYYCGPTPAKKGKVIGSCGPTTSSRMDKYMALLLKKGLKATIGKGERSEEVRNLIKKFKGIYFITWAGCGAYLSKFVKNKTLIAYPELEAEAVFELEVEKFPLIVAIDSRGKDIFERRNP